MAKKKAAKKKTAKKKVAKKKAKKQFFLRKYIAKDLESDLGVFFWPFLPSKALGLYFGDFTNHLLNREGALIDPTRIDLN